MINLDPRTRESRLDELDRLLNDPETRMDPARVWNILAELSAQDARTPDSAARA